MFLHIRPFSIYLLVHIVPQLTHWKQCIETKDISLPLTVYKVKKKLRSIAVHMVIYCLKMSESSIQHTSGTFMFPDTCYRRMWLHLAVLFVTQIYRVFRCVQDTRFAEWLTCDRMIKDYTQTKP
jgi:hypothetical protein